MYICIYIYILYNYIFIGDHFGGRSYHFMIQTICVVDPHFFHRSSTFHQERYDRVCKVFTSKEKRLCMYMYMYLCICLYVYMYLCIYVSMYIVSENGGFLK